MSTPHEYRLYAKICTDLAASVSDKIERAVLLNIADQWRRLANHKEKQRRSQEPANSN
jgi:hypothetical protein